MSVGSARRVGSFQRVQDYWRTEDLHIVYALGRPLANDCRLFCWEQQSRKEGLTELYGEGWAHGQQIRQRILQTLGPIDDSFPPLRGNLRYQQCLGSKEFPRSYWRCWTEWTRLSEAVNMLRSYSRYNFCWWQSLFHAFVPMRYSSKLKGRLQLFAAAARPYANPNRSNCDLLCKQRRLQRQRR